MPNFERGPQPLSSAQVEAMRNTVLRAQEAVREVVRRERERSQGLVCGDRLTRKGLDVATDLLDIPRASDAEWSEVSGMLDSRDSRR